MKKVEVQAPLVAVAGKGGMRRWKKIRVSVGFIGFSVIEMNSDIPDAC